MSEIAFQMQGTTFSIQTDGSYIEMADDSLTIVGNDKILFFSKWRVYSHSLKAFNVKIRKAKSNNKVTFENSTSILFYDYFRCPSVYYRNLNIDEQDFKKIYLDILPNKHNPRVWYKLATSIIPYGKSLLL